MLSCRDVTELASDYVDKVLPRRSWAAMKFHLLICGMCRAYLDQLHKTKRLLGRGSLSPPPPEVEAKLVAAAHSPGHSPGPPPSGGVSPPG
jgi:hypothetical protein